MVEAGHADAAPAERRRAVQARTAEEIDASARLSQMSAQLLRNDRIEPPRSADGCRVVLLPRGVERGLRSKAWCGHWAPQRKIVSLLYAITAEKAWRVRVTDYPTGFVLPAFATG
jgi:hypothetical protein